MGTGIIVGHVVVTAHHLVPDYHPAEICREQYCKILEPVKGDSFYDLSLFEWPGERSSIRVGEVPEHGDIVYVHAYPKGRHIMAEAKVISDDYSKTGLGGTPAIPIDVYLPPGSSGGAVFNENGELVGILHASSRSTGITYMTHTLSLQDFIPYFYK